MYLYCVSKKLRDRNENKNPKVWEKNPIKSAWKLRLNKNKQIEYAKKIIKESLLEVHKGRGQVQQYNQDKESRLDLAGYAI